MAEIIGNALVEISPDLTRFEEILKRSLEASIKKVEASAAATLKVDVEAGGAKAFAVSIDKMNQSMEKVADSVKEVAKSLEAVAKSIENIAKNSKNIKFGDIGAQTSGFRKFLEVVQLTSSILSSIVSIGANTALLLKFGQTAKVVAADFKVFNAEVTGIRGAVTAFTQAVQKNVPVMTQQQRAVNETGKAFGSAAGAAGGVARSVQDLQRDTDRLTTTVKKVKPSTDEAAKGFSKLKDETGAVSLGLLTGSGFFERFTRKNKEAAESISETTSKTSIFSKIFEVLAGVFTRTGAALSNFFNGITSAVRGLGSLGNFAVTVGQGMGRLASFVGGGVNALKNFALNSSGAEKALAALGVTTIGVAAIIGVQLIAKLGELVQRGIQAAAQIQKTKIALQGVFQSTDAEATKTFETIQKFAALTPFTLNTAANAVVKLKSSFQGFSATDALSVLKDIASAAANVGASDDAINRAVLAITQIGAKGRLSAEELNQIAEAIPTISRVKVFEVLAENLNKTTAEVQKLADAGGISAAQGITAILEAARTAPGAGEALEKQAATFQGALSTIKDNLNNLLGQAFLPFLDVLSELINKSGAFFEALKPDIEIFAKSIGQAFKALAPAIGGAILAFSNLLAALSPLLVLSAQLFGLFEGPAQAALAAVTLLLRTALVPILDLAGRVLGFVLEKVNDLVGLASKIPFVGKAFAGLKEATKGLAGSFADLGLDSEAAVRKLGDASKDTRFADFLKEGLANSEALRSVLNSVTSAQKALTAAQRGVGEVDKQLVELANQRLQILKDTTSEAREIAVAEDAVLRSVNRIRDIELERTSILKEIAELQLPATQEELAEGQDRITRAQIALNRAKREQIELEKKITPVQKTSLDLSGLSLDQIRSKLANLRATNAAQRANATATQEEGKTQEEIDEDRILKELSVKDAQREVNDAIEAQTILQDRVKNNADAIATKTQELTDLEIDVRDAIRQREEAMGGLAALRDGETTKASSLLGIDQQITTLNEQRKTAVQNIKDNEEAVKVAKDAQRLKVAEILGDEQTINQLLIDRSGILKGIGGLDAQAQKASFISILPALLRGAQLTGGRAGPPLITPDTIAQISDRLLKDPSSDIRAVLKEILRALGLEIPGLAEGALVTAPGLYNLGEGFRPEVVLPLTRPARLESLLGSPMVLNPVLNALGRITLPAPTAARTLSSAINTPLRSRGAGQTAASAKPTSLEQKIDRLIQLQEEANAKKTEVNAPITVTTSDPQLAARRIARELQRKLGSA